ncbi:MAG: hypothetical protein JOZ05_07320 [Acetobacteraceae bacterium]|nr:hypothetical protein [Acetobacteraceae bacterium]
MILAALAALLIGAAAAVWIVDAVSRGACAITSPGCLAARSTGAAIGAAVLSGAVCLALLLPRRIARAWSIALAALAVLGVGLELALAPEDGRLGVLAGETSLGLLFVVLLVGSVWSWAASLRRTEVRATLRSILSNPSWFLLFGVLAIGTVFYVEHSHRILFWDPLNYWQKTDQVAALIQQGLSLHDVAQLLRTASDDYSMVPALLPGVLTSFFAQGNVLAYLVAVAICYVIPASIAIGCLGLVLAGARAPGRYSRMDLIVLGGVAGFALLPIFLQTFLRSAYLDIGGVPVMVLLAFAWDRCVRLLAAPDPAVPAERRALQLISAGVAVALLSILGFVFRRWYVFDVLGFAVAAGFWIFGTLLRSGRTIGARLRDLAVMGSAALLTGLTLGAPILADWAATWQRRQFTEAYAAYWLGWGEELGRAFGAFGLIVPVACVLVLLARMFRGSARAMAFILLFGTAIGLAGFFRVEAMGYQHYYLLMPALSGAAAAACILIATRAGIFVASAFVLLAGLALTVLPRQDNALALLLPESVDLSPPSDPNIPELVRLGHWLNDNLGPGDGYCVLASSLRMNGSLVQEAWQADPALAHSRARTGHLWLGEVDTWQGPPAEKIQGCTIMITTTPPVTDLKASDQQSILLPREDLLAGAGIGADYAKTPATFTVNGLTVETWKRQRPISDAELGDLRHRFFEGKGDEAARYRARFNNPKFDHPT